MAAQEGVMLDCKLHHVEEEMGKEIACAHEVELEQEQEIAGAHQVAKAATEANGAALDQALAP